MNEYDDLLASEGTKDEARTNLRASVIGALPTNPDQYAEAKRLAKTSGVPAPVVERNMDEVRKQVTLNEYDSLIERAPVTASKFQNPEFAKLAHDERDQLADLEDFIKKAPGGRHSTDMGDALKRGTVQLGVLGEAAAYGLDRMLTAIGKRFLPEPAVPGGEVDATSGQVKASLVEVANLYSNLPRDKRVDFAGELVNRAAAEGKTLRGIGDAIAYIATPGGAMGALNYLIEMTPSAAVGGGIGGLAVKPIAAKVASQAVARGVTAAAVTGVGTTTNAFPAELAGQISEGNGVDEALGYAGTKATVEGLVNAPFGFAGGMLPLGATLTGKVGNIIGQAGLQGTGGAVGATAAAASVGEEITPGEQFLEAFFELASAPSDIAIAAATDVAERRNTTKVQADQATASADHLTKIMLAAEASKTRLRDPETFAQLVQDAAEASGTAPTEVFIDAQPLVDTLQKAGMTEAQIREALPSVAEQLGTEYTTGGTVAIPIGEAVAAFAGTGAEADLVRFARTTEDGYSVADSEQALAALEEMDADAQRIIAEQQDADAWAQSAQVVEDTLFAQLEGAGRFSSDVNRTYATILRNYYVTQAEVMGITPEALYKQFPLTASGVAPTGQVLSQPGGQVDEATGLPLNSDGTVTVYHHTSAENAARIRETGALRSAGEPDVYLTTRRETDTGYGDTAVPVRINPALLALDDEFPDGRRDFRASVGKPGGSMAVTIGEADTNLNQTAYTDEEIDFLVADGSLSPEQAATLKADAKNRGQNADARIAGADRRAQQGTGTTGRPTGQVYGRTVAGTSPRSGWESATRVRGADGQPRRTYRGSRFGRLTAANFADDQLGLNSTHPSAGLGVWFSTDQSDAASYGEVSEQFLDLRNPKVFGPSELPAFDSLEQSIAFREALRAKGHDGIALDYRSVGGPVQFVAFDPEQVVEPGGELYQSGGGATISSLTAELEREHPGLKLNLIDGRNAVTLSRIVLPQEQRNAGTGTAIMQRVVEWADANAKVLALTPSSDFGGNKKRLTQFYKRFGFVENKGKSKDFTISEAMVRQPEMNVLNQSAYHGSPYRFCKFSLEHMGKGEGAQAYGWGLYFAGEDEVADWYRAKLSDSYAGQSLTDDMFLVRSGEKNAAEFDVSARREIVDFAKARDKDGLIAFLDREVERWGELADDESYPFRPYAQEKFDAAQAFREQVREFGVSFGRGQLYEVNIPEEGEYLLWDKPLSEQPEKVRAALEALKNSDLVTDYTKMVIGLGGVGAAIHDALSSDDRIRENRSVNESAEYVSKMLHSLGIAGIKYLDGTSRGAGEGSYNYVIFDDNAVEILNTFYQNQPGKAEARGSFNPTTLNIALLEKADLSTFLHETGHFFFEMQVTIAARPDAPARIVNDVAILLKEVGFTGTAAEWLAQPLDARREAHEKVAESFEQYLITGDAPTVELQGLFNQMRAWMLAVYKTLKQFFAVNKRAGLSAEVAGVFDRMLASDAAIAETKRVRAMSPLFTSAEAAGMTAEEWTAYQADAGQMDADARRDLDARQVRDMKWLRTARGKALKALQADASAKRREARIEARRRLLQEPVYRAMQFLRGKVEKAEVEKKAKGLDTRRDDLLTAIAKLGGLNKDLVVAEWGIDPKDFAKSPVFGKPILRGGKAGLSPDGMGEALAEVGYLQPKDGDRYSLADFEAMFNDAARGIQHYSLDADYDLIHGYKTLPVSADLGEQPFAAGRLSRPDLEARFSGTDVDWQRLGVGRRGMIAEVGMDADAVANIVGFNTGEEMVKALLAAEPLQDATEALTDQIMLERHGDITSPEGLQRAADEALANDAHAKLLATEYARLNKAVGSPRAVQLAAKEAAERTVDRQAVRLARPEKATAAAARAGKAAEKAHAAGNLDEAAGFKRNQILNTAIARAQRELRTFVEKAQGDFAKMFGKDDQRAKTRDMNLVNLARAALAQYGLAPTSGGKQALQYLDLVTQYDPALAENLKSMLAAMPEGKDFRDLTAGEFRTVASLVRGMWEMSRGVKQITIDGKKVEIDAAADELVAAVTANNGGEQGNLPGYSGTTTTADDLRVGALGIKSMLTRVEQWADYMGPAFKRFIWQPVSEAVTRYRVRRNEMVKQYRDLLKTIEPDLTFHKIHAPELGAAGFTFNGGKSEVLHAILHSGNKSNLRKLLLGPGYGNPSAAWATIDAEGELDTSRWDSFVERMVDEGVITRNDMDFVQGVWDLLETVKGDAQKAHRELYGYYFNEVTATAFVDPFGVERRGGYVPALADGLSSPDAMQKREQEDLLHAGNSFMFPSTGKGFTQSRVEYNRPLELDLRTIGSHLDKVTRFAYIEPAVRDVGKLLLNKRVSRALNGYDQTIISQMLNPWLQRAARQTISVPGKNRWADKFFNGLRSRSGVVIMFANVVNTLQQITGFSVAALKVPAPVLLRATYRMVTDPKRMSAEAAALSPWLAERMAGQSFEMQQEIKNILVNPNPLVKGNEFLKHNAYFMQQAMQNMMDPIIWWGAYDNATANGANQRDAIRAGDEAVRTTQGTFAPEDVSAFESNTAFVRLFTQFYGYFNMLANTLGLEAKKAIRDMGYGAATPRLLFIWFAGLALPAVVGEIIARGLPDDEDDEDGDGVLDEWLALFFGSQFRTLAAMAPGAGQGVSLAVNLTDDKVYNDRLSISPGMSMAETTIRGGVNLLQGEVFDERLTKSEVRDTLTLIGMATGAPTGAVARSAGYLVDVENGRADPENPVEFAVGLTTGR